MKNQTISDKNAVLIILFPKDFKAACNVCSIQEWGSSHMDLQKVSVVLFQSSDRGSCGTPGVDRQVGRRVPNVGFYNLSISSETIYVGRLYRNGQHWYLQYQEKRLDGTRLCLKTWNKDVKVWLRIQWKVFGRFFEDDVHRSICRTLH